MSTEELSQTLVAGLKEGLAKLRQQQAAFEEGVEQRRLDFEEEIKTRRDAFERRVQLLTQAIEGLENGGNSNNTRPAMEEVATLSISDERRQAVSDYLAKKGRARQADIAEHLGFNSGTVSVALRVLEAEGVVDRLDEKKRGSQVWAHRQPVARRIRVASNQGAAA